MTRFGQMIVPRWVWGFVTAALLWSWSLYLVGWWLTPPKHRYFWVASDVSDYNAHLRWARQAWEGKTRFANLFTTEPHQPRTFNLHDWFVGKLAKWLGISLHLSLRFVQSVGVIVFVLAAWWLSTPLLTEAQQRTYLLMLCFLGGFLWLAMPEANTFIALATGPWFVWGKALAALMMGSMVRMETRGDGQRTKREIATAAFGIAAGTVLGNIHPYALAPIGYALALYFVGKLVGVALSRDLLPRRSIGAFWGTAFMALPAFVSAGWQALAILGDPIYRSEFQFPLQTPPFWLFALNYGIILALAVWAAAHWLRVSDAHRWHLLIAWLLGAFLAVYLTPTEQPRKLIEGAHLPMCLLAAWAWHELLLPHTVVIRRHPVLVLLLLGGIAPLTFWVSQVRNFPQNDAIALHYGGVPFYLRESHLQLISWLAHHTRTDEAVLCHYALGNYLPVLIGRRVFLGHWAGTYQVRQKLRDAVLIWRGEMPPEKARRLFRQHRLRYALATLYECHATKPRHRPNECEKVPERFHLDRYGVIVFRVGSEAVYRLRW
ncbi:MAG: hypothetical protein SLRJCFUN_002532 [Candidatus Fervidibacter sp.]